MATVHLARLTPHLRAAPLHLWKEVAAAILQLQLLERVLRLAIQHCGALALAEALQQKAACTVASSRSKSMKQVWRNTAADEPHNTLAVTESLRGGIGSPSDDLTTAAAA